jgi:hypothetical protein
MKITDIIMIVALFGGPIAAVWISESRRRKDEIQHQRIHVFRTLMATRTTTLYQNHIEALNLVEIEFYNDRRIMDAWQLYRNHLDDSEFIKRDLLAWDKERNKLLIDLLYEMSIVLGYSFDKSQIQQGVYYPTGYQRVENENAEARTLWLQVLKGERQLPMKAEVYTKQTIPPTPVTPAKETLPEKPDGK